MHVPDCHLAPCHGFMAAASVICPRPLRRLPFKCSLVPTSVLRCCLLPSRQLIRNKCEFISSNLSSTFRGNSGLGAGRGDLMAKDLICVRRWGTVSAPPARCTILSARCCDAGVGLCDRFLCELAHRGGGQWATRRPWIRTREQGSIGLRATRGAFHARP